MHADLDVRDAIDAAAADVEQREGVPIEVVRVGEMCGLDEHMRALVLAAREAMVERVAPFGRTVDRRVPRGRGRAGHRVRARPGSGFDVASVPDDRGGIAESVTGRVQRHGGVATIRSRPGVGTEVELWMRRNGA